MAWIDYKKVYDMIPTNQDNRMLENLQDVRTICKLHQENYGKLESGASCRRKITPSNGKNPDFTFIKISWDVQKCPGDLRRLAVIQTPVKKKKKKKKKPVQAGAKNWYSVSIDKIFFKKKSGEGAILFYSIYLISSLIHSKCRLHFWRKIK